MRLLVTGGAGFIGSNFIIYWLGAHPDDAIVNLDVLTYAGNLENLKPVEHDARYTFIHGDICDSDTVKRALEGIDVVVHFAAESHVDRSIMSPAPFIMTNILGTYTMLEASVKAGISRFHHISTDEVFGSLELESSSKFNERTPYDPRSPYSASKASSDHLVRSYYHTYGLGVTITNCSNNFGPYHFPEKLIPLAITNALEDKNIPVYGDGRNVRDWLYVEDHCRAIEAVVLRGRPGETYCVGGDTPDLSNLSVIKKILSIMGKSENLIEFVRDRPGHDRRYAVDWSKIHTELGWKPLHDFDSRIEETIQWFTSHQAWWKRVKSGRYRDYYKTQYGGTA